MRLFLNVLPLFLKKVIFSQLQMIQCSELPMVMAPCHGTMGHYTKVHVYWSDMYKVMLYRILVLIALAYQACIFHEQQ